MADRSEDGLSAGGKTRSIQHTNFSPAGEFRSQSSDWLLAHYVNNLYRGGC
jgi:hypothetical protein